MRSGVKWYASGALVAAAIIVLAVAHAEGNALARYAWHSLHMPELALTLDRSDATLAMEIGNSYFGSATVGSYDTRYNPTLAKRAFQEALAFKPGIIWGHYMLARIAFTEGDFATALAEINAELAANAGNLRSLYVRGLIYLYRNSPGDLALAETDFSSFVHWAPTEWAGYNDLSFVLAKEQKYAQSEAVLEEAFNHVPNADQNVWLWNSLGVAQLNQSQFAAAEGSFTTALALANRLTPEDWRRAYTGDPPSGDAASIKAFQEAIRKNMYFTQTQMF